MLRNVLLSEKQTRCPLNFPQNNLLLLMILSVSELNKKNNLLFIYSLLTKKISLSLFLPSTGIIRTDFLILDISTYLWLLDILPDMFQDLSELKIDHTGLEEHLMTSLKHFTRVSSKRL